jgi:hypothetical protein
MKKLSVCVLVLFSILITSCTQTENISKNCDEDPSQENCIKNKNTENVDYKGLTEVDAEKLAKTQDVTFRVITRDGENLPVTLDYRPGRINAEVTGSIVSNYTVE